MVSNSTKDKIRKAKKHYFGRNCIGTALYITKRQPHDVAIEPEDFDVNSFGLVEVHEPRIEAIAIWDYFSLMEIRRRVLHMGVVTHLNPTLVTHRPGYNRSLIENESIGDISEGYPCPARFYLPSR
ncbi:MAG TPA: hypothetical protein VMC07_02435 [Candidatus Omnitrophota bacterium]|nr:hypothetical protein [Candidatus Omnitrophota bacterium]